MTAPKNPLFSHGVKPTTAGFIVVDVSETPSRPLQLTGSGLFAIATEKPSFFRIEMRKPRMPDLCRFTERQYSYRYARKELQKIIDRHHRILLQMQSSSLTRDWARTKNAALLKLKIKPIKKP